MRADEEASSANDGRNYHRIPMTSATTVIVADVITMDRANPRAEAVAFRGGTVVAVGRRAEVCARAGPHSTVIELEGTVVPGFIDPHHHLFLVAADRWGWRPPDLAPRSIPALLAEIRAIAAADDDDGWLRIHGYKPLALAERRSPTAAELDSACEDRPLLVLGLTYHESSLNSLGLARLGWHHATPDPPGGRIVRDRRGRPTGVVIESASLIAEATSRSTLIRPDSAARWSERARRHALVLAHAGITRIGDAAVPPVGMSLYDDLVSTGGLAVTVHRFPVGESAVSTPVTDPLPTTARKNDLTGAARAPVGPAKLLADGGERCALCMTGRQVLSSVVSTVRYTLTRGLRVATIANRGGRATRGDDHRYYTGMRVLDDDGLHDSVTRLAGHGMQVAIHAIGNAGVEASLGALEAAAGTLAGLPGAPRLEHAMILDKPLVERIAAARVRVVTQPVFLRDLGDELAALPLPRPLRLMPTRSLLDAGVVVAASSDFPAASLEPLTGIQTAITRRLRDGSQVAPEEALSPEEALRLYTTSAADSLGLTGRAGVLSEGADADLVLLSGDPLATDPERISAIRVLKTWVAGRLVVGETTSHDRA